jgi:hypothetical protein
MKKISSKKSASSSATKIKKKVENRDIKAVARQLGNHLKGMRTKYEALDTGTKKKLLAALGAATAILVTAHKIKKTVKKKKKA